MLHVAGTCSVLDNSSVDLVDTGRENGTAGCVAVADGMVYLTGIGSDSSGFVGDRQESVVHIEYSYSDAFCCRQKILVCLVQIHRHSQTIHSRLVLHEG